MKILKFGGKSLANGKSLKQSIDILIKASQKGSIGVVVSARGSDTDKLIELAHLAKKGEPFKDKLVAFFDYHKEDIKQINFDLEYYHLYESLKAIQALRILNQDILDGILAYGELISSKCISHLLRLKNIH